MTDADDYTAFLVAEERARNERLRAPAHDPLCHAYALTVNGGYHDPECCDCDLIARVRADERAKAHVHNTGTSSPDACCECCYDVPALLRWKREAIAVLDAWERVYEALGVPGSLGESKAAAALAAVQSVEWGDSPIIGGAS